MGRRISTNSGGAAIGQVLVRGIAVLLCFHQLEYWVICMGSGGHHHTVLCNSRNARCSVHNAYGEWPDLRSCRAAAVVYPSTEAELLEAVAAGVRRGQSMKVVTSTGHSMPKWSCPRGRSGLLISTQNYNRNIDVDQSSFTVRADSGVQLRQLVDTLAHAGLALPYTPYWDGITLGGLLSTGSHGSSFFNQGGAVHEYVVSMRLVVPASSHQGYAKVITLSKQDERLNAAKVSLGVLGVISQVTLAVEAQFKRSVSKRLSSDDNVEEQIVALGHAHEFGDLAWLPAQHKLLLSMDHRVPLQTEGDGVNAFLPFRPTPTFVRSWLRALEETSEAFSSATSKCLLSAVQSSARFSQGHGLKNNKERFEGYPVIGFQHHMQTSGGCSRSTDPRWACPWAWPGVMKGFFFHETSFTIPVENVSNFVRDVKKLRDLEPTSFCGLDLYSGILMRFVKKSTAYLGNQADGVAMDITYYRAKDAHTPRLDEDIIEEIEQMAFFKYGAAPHWGKNRPLAFEGLSAKYPLMKQFHAVRRSLDPEGLFSSEWSDATLGISGNVSADHDYCALNGLCVCNEDRHCAPERGYYCRPGKVYRNARVCSARSESSNHIISFAWHALGNLVHAQLNAWLQASIIASVTVAFQIMQYFGMYLGLPT